MSARPDTTQQLRWMAPLLLAVIAGSALWLWGGGGSWAGDQVQRLETLRAPASVPPGRAGMPQPVRAPRLMDGLVAPAIVAHAAADTEQPVLRVLDTGGDPIADAFAYLSSATPERWAVGDAQGLLPLPMTLPDDDAFLETGIDVEVCAAGRRRERITLSPDMRWPQDVVLRAATTLDVFVDARVPADEAVRYHVSVVGTGSVFEDEGKTFQREYRDLFGLRVGGWISAQGGMDIGLHALDDRHRFVGIRPGVPLTVEVTGPMSERLGSRTVELRPAEHRTIRLAVSEDVRSLEGLVTDQTGLPVGGAEVNVWPANGEDNSYWVEDTDALGAFRVAAILCREIDLWVAVDGHERHEARIDLDATSVHDIALQPAELFTVSILQAESRRPVRKSNVMDTWSIWNHDWDTDQSVDEPGVFHIPGLPPRAVQLDVRAGGRTYPLTRTPGMRSAEVLVPEMGQVRVSWRTPPTMSGTDSGRVRFAPVDQPDEDVLGRSLRGVPFETGLLVDEVPVGTYRVQHVVYEPDDRSWRPLAEAEVSVRAGQESLAELMPTSGAGDGTGNN